MQKAFFLLPVFPPFLAAAGASCAQPIPGASCAGNTRGAHEDNVFLQFEGTLQKTMKESGHPGLEDTEALSSVKEKMNEDTGGYDYGEEYGPEELARRTGVFRGVALTKDAKDTNLREVLKFKKEILDRGEEELKMRVLLTPDLETTEGSMESTSSSAIEKANKVISSYGTSAMQSESMSAGLEVDTGVASANLNVGSSQESEQSAEGEQAEAQRLSKQSHSYTKTKYYFEPRAVLVADPNILIPTDQFSDAVSKLGSDYTIEDLFQDFGTHTCTKVLLGGWWRITANYKSKSSKASVEMSKAASSAIAEASSLSAEASASYGSVSASASYESSEKSRSTQSSSSEQATSSTDSESVLDVYEEWKGGMSGGNELQWRTSLDRKKNSNWKIIDRNVDSCIGIWRWVDNSTLKIEMCQAWERNFFASMDVGEYDPNMSQCKGNANMQEMRKELVAKKKKKDSAKKAKASQLLHAAKAQCEAVRGFHLDETLLTQESFDESQKEETTFLRVKNRYCKKFTRNHNIIVSFDNDGGGQPLIAMTNSESIKLIDDNRPHGRPRHLDKGSCEDQCAQDPACNAYDVSNEHFIGLHEWCNHDKGDYTQECLALGGDSISDKSFHHYVKVPKGSFCRANVCHCGTNDESAKGPECEHHGAEYCPE